MMYVISCPIPNLPPASSEKRCRAERSVKVRISKPQISLFVRIMRTRLLRFFPPTSENTLRRNCMNVVHIICLVDTFIVQ